MRSGHRVWPGQKTRLQGASAQCVLAVERWIVVLLGVAGHGAVGHGDASARAGIWQGQREDGPVVRPLAGSGRPGRTLQERQRQLWYLYAVPLSLLPGGMREMLHGQTLGFAEIAPRWDWLATSAAVRFADSYSKRCDFLRPGYL
jgi:hypothetical protein